MSRIESFTEDLNDSVAIAVRGADERTVAAASRKLSEGYRQGSSVSIADAVTAAAYAAVRAPATFAASAAVLGAVAQVLPDFQPTSQIDLGAGIGSASWAACGTWPSISRVTLVDQSDALIELGRLIQQLGNRTRSKQWDWERSKLAETQLPTGDLVTASYVVGELGPAEQLRFARAAWDITVGGLVVIEPGTPRGFDTIRRIRRALISDGACLLAPCPHANECPLGTNRWCHFPVRFNRSPLHRRVKDVDLPYEDERFSYVAFGRAGGPLPAGRVIGHPRRPRRRVHLEVCTPRGIENIIIPHSRRNDYRLAKSLGWGSETPAGLVDIRKDGGVD